MSIPVIPTVNILFSIQTIHYLPANIVQDSFMHILSKLKLLSTDGAYICLKQQ